MADIKPLYRIGTSGMMSSTSITHKITYNNMVPFKIDHQITQVSCDESIEYATCT
jgi:hypothetical protein